MILLNILIRPNVLNFACICPCVCVLLSFSFVLFLQSAQVVILSVILGATVT